MLVVYAYRRSIGLSVSLTFIGFTVFCFEQHSHQTCTSQEQILCCACGVCGLAVIIDDLTASEHFVVYIACVSTYQKQWLHIVGLSLKFISFTVSCYEQQS